MVPCDVMNFLMLVIVGRACGADGLGLYALALNITVVLTTFQHAMIAYPYTVYSARLDRTELRACTGSTLVHQVLLASLAIPALYLGELVLSHGYGPAGLAPVLAALKWSLVPILLRDYFRRILFARFLFGRALIFDTGIALAQVGLLLILSWTGRLSPSLTATVGLFLVSRFAISGALLSMLAVNLTTGVYRFWQFWLVTRTPKVAVVSCDD